MEIISTVALALGVKNPGTVVLRMNQYMSTAEKRLSKARPLTSPIVRKSQAPRGLDSYGIYVSWYGMERQYQVV